MQVSRQLDLLHGRIWKSASFRQDAKNVLQDHATEGGRPGPQEPSLNPLLGSCRVYLVGRRNPLVRDLETWKRVVNGGLIVVILINLYPPRGVLELHTQPGRVPFCM